MRHRIFRNGLLKLAAIILAVTAWIIIYNVNDPIQSRRYTNIEVQLENTSEVTDENQVYSILDQSDTLTSVTVHAPRSVLNELEPSDIVVVADFNNLTLEGAVALEASTLKYNSSIENIVLSKDELKVSVEDSETKPLPLRIETVGSTGEGYVVGKTSVNQNQVVVEGAKSIVDEITKAVVYVDLALATADIATVGEVLLLDNSGEVVPMDGLQVNISKVDVLVEILATKTVPVHYEVTGTPANDYVYLDDIETEYTEVSIAGSTLALDKITEIVVDAEGLDVEGATSDVILNIDIDDYLPTGLRRSDLTESGETEVTLNIERIVEKELVYSRAEIELVNLLPNYEVTVEEGQSASLVLKGTTAHVNAANTGSVRATVDVAAFIESLGEEELVAGSYEIVPEFMIPEGIEVEEVSSSNILIYINAIVN